MKLAKSLLLGSAAALVASAGAQAADLPYRKAAPVEYVRVCDWTGAGYFYIPGTDSCLNISGYLRAEYAWIQQTKVLLPTPTYRVAGVARGSTYTLISGRNRDASGFKADGRIAADVRTQTAYGTLRTYVRFDLVKVNGNYAGGLPTLSNGNSSAANLDKGFIQFAGITAGRVQSFFDFYADNYNYEGIANSDQSNNVFAYTYNAAGGFSATIAAEDRNTRNDGIGQIYNGSGTGYGVSGVTPATIGYAGETFPDAVANLRVDQAWGAAQISAAYHDVNTISTTGYHYTTEGFAVQGGVQIKLPMLAAGDDLWIQGAYQDGAYLYQDSAGSMNGGFNNLAVGGFQHLDKDAVAYQSVPGAGSNAYKLAKSRGFSVLAAINHYFTPNFHDVLFGSYEQVGYGSIVKNIDWTYGGIGDAKEYRIGNQFLWDPVKNLEIGIEVFYAKIDQKLAHNPGQAPTALPAGVKLNSDAFEARLRMERDF